MEQLRILVIVGVVIVVLCAGFTLFSIVSWLLDLINVCIGACNEPS
jgi:uncharacterized protein YqfA (UPF0365 family)